jgi:hypothetical protein
MRKYLGGATATVVATVIGFSLVLSSTGVSAAPGGRGASGSSVKTTHRKVRGIITEMEGSALTIAPLVARAEMTGRIDPKRTRIEVDGRPARPVDLEVTLSANAELGLDDVWVSIRATTR